MTTEPKGQPVRPAREVARDLRRDVVARIVGRLMPSAKQTLHGFEFDGLRLQSGGGIAGNSRVWWLNTIAFGTTLAGPITTRKQLREAVVKHAPMPR